MIRVVLADDHAVVRRGVRQILADADDIDVIGEAKDFAELSALLRNVECNVLVLDISMPGKNGIDVLKSVRERYPKMQVIILSMFPEDQYAVRALKNGAAGYVSKEAAPENLVEAIRQASRGKKYVTPAVALALAERIDDKSGAERPLHETLSDREYETLRLIANGKKLSEIAEILALSPKTVSVYRARLLEKMKLRNNADIARYAAKLGLIE